MPCVWPGPEHIRPRNGGPSHGSRTPDPHRLHVRPCRPRPPLPQGRANGLQSVAVRGGDHLFHHAVIFAVLHAGYGGFTHRALTRQFPALGLQHVGPLSADAGFVRFHRAREALPGLAPSFPDAVQHETGGLLRHPSCPCADLCWSRPPDSSFPSIWRIATAEASPWTAPGPSVF